MEVDGFRTYKNVTPPTKTTQNQLNSQKTADSVSVEQIETSAGATNQTQESDSSLNKAITAYRNEKLEEKKAQREAEASDKMLKTAVEVANAQLKASHRMLQCNIHEKTNRIMVKVVDTDTKEVVREIPPEKTLDLFAKVLEMAGILFDEKK